MTSHLLSIWTRKTCNAQVVAHERPDLQEQAASLSTQLASYIITLKELEDNLLQRLAASQVCCRLEC